MRLPDLSSISGTTDAQAIALARVIDDADPALEAIAWAAAELLAGRDPAAVQDALVDQGWPQEVAGAAVETARVQTRGERGIVTRNDVVGDPRTRYRHATVGMAAFNSSGLGLIGFMVGLRSALRSLKRLRWLASRR